ncbi:DUF2993 domain-containing protein [Streptomyces sp. NPDC001315]|uniref:LmeA family phospholipid-binding protein n=1 Tax=Streptomyces sp. NPDC001315 TaxID=3364562 RepID=UPI003696A53F
MRALRVLLIVVVILGVLFVVVDRVAVHFAEGEAADKLKTTEGLANTPDVSIDGFPFLTQVAGGELDDVEVGIKDYDAATATGTATIAYDELLKAAKSEPTRVGPGVTAQVVGLSDGGNGKIKVQVDATVLGVKLPRPVSVLSTVTVNGDTVQVRADSLPDLGVDLAENAVRSITDFQQAIEELPGGVQLDKVEAASDGVKISVRGSNVRLAG